MNKLFTKIAKVFLGLSLAAGVGVAVGSKSKEAAPVHAADTFSKVTDASTLSSGDVLAIVCESKGDALSTTQNTNNRGAQAVSISNSSFTFVSGVQEIALSGSSGAWILTAGSVRLSGVNNQNYLKNGTDTWSISISSGNATITSAVSGRIIKRNSSSALYGTYSSGQTAVQIYRKAATKTLSSIALSGSMTKTSYTTDESFSAAGITVTGTYSDSSSANITSSATFGFYSNSTMTSVATPSSLGTGSKTIYIKATVSGVSNTTAKSQSVTITEPPALIEDGNYFISFNNSGTRYYANDASSVNSYGAPLLVGASATTKGIYTISRVSGNVYTIQLGSDYLIVGKNENNGVKFNSTLNDNAKWTVAKSGDNFTFKNVAYNTRYLSNYGSTDVRTYTSTCDVYLEEVVNYTVTFAVNTAGYGTVSESSISVPSGSTITTSNNTVTINGITVTATPTANTAQYTYAFSSWTNASGTVTAARTITANFTRTTNTFTVGGTIQNGSLSSTASVAYGNALNISINPGSGHVLPDALTSVTMGGNALVAGTGYTYDNSTGAFSIASVTGNVVINATCPIDGVPHNISGSISNGSLTGDTGEQIEGKDYIVQIVPNTLYKYPTSVVVTGAGVEDTGWEYSSTDGLLYIYDLEDDVSITATCPAASITSLSVSGQKTSFVLGEDFSFGGTVKATYDDVAHSTNVPINTNLVTIDSSAYYAFAETTYSITVILKADANVSTSYTVTVARKSIVTNVTWELLESEPDVFDGEYIILSANESYYPTTSVDGSGRAVNGTAPTVTNNVIDDADVTSAMIWIINAEGSFESDGETVYYYSIKNKADNKYLTAKSSKQLEFNTTLKDEDAEDYDYDVWQLTYNDIYNQGLESDYYLRSNGTYGWRCYNSGTGSKPAFYKKVSTATDVRSLIKLSATGPAANVKVEDDEVSASDFVATALFDTAESETVTPTVVSVNGGSASAHLIAGSNTIVLSYTDPNNSSNTKTCEVTVVAAEQTAELDGITWDKETIEITQYEGSTIVYGSLHKHYDNGTTTALDLSECTVAIYTKSGLVFTKDHDIANPTSYELDIDDDNGKYLGVSYSGYTLYSGKVNVVEVLESIKSKTETTLSEEYVAKDQGYTSGQVVNSYEGTVFSLGFTKGTNNDPKYYSSDYTMRVYVGGTITVSSSKTLKEIRFAGYSGTITANVGTFSSGTWTGSASTIEFSVSANMKFTSLTVYYDAIVEGDNIANTNIAVQKAVLDYVALFNETMSCVQAGTTANVSTKWSSVSSEFTTLLNNFNDDDLDHCKNLFAYADSVDGGDSLQDMLARYDYIVGKYKSLSDFLHVSADRPEVQRSAVISPLTLIGLNGENANTIAIIVIISMVSVTAIGGYFFLRKRKENI